MKQKVSNPDRTAERDRQDFLKYKQQVETTGNFFLRQRNFKPK